MSDKWTAGPWFVRPQKSMAHAAGIFGPKQHGHDRVWIADTDVGLGIDSTEQQANARLIAQAPAMATLLRRAHAELYEHRLKNPSATSKSLLPEIEQLLKDLEG